MMYLSRSNAFDKALAAVSSIGREIKKIHNKSVSTPEGQNVNMLEEFVKPGQEFVEAIYSDEAIDIAQRLDSEGFAEYFRMIGELAIRLNIPEKYYFTGMQLVTKANLEKALEAASTALGKVEVLEGFHAGELAGLTEEYKEKLISEIRDGWFISKENKERQIQKLQSNIVEVGSPYVRIKDRGLTDFYEDIAGIARSGYAAGLQCGNFVHDMIRDKLENGNEIVEKVFPSGVKEANELFEDFKTNKNLQPLAAAGPEDLERIQREADRGTLILAVFLNKTHKSKEDGLYHGHIAFVGNSKLTVNSSPDCIAKQDDGKEIYNYKNETPRESPSTPGSNAALWLLLVQAGTFKGIVPIRVGTNGWMTKGTRGNLLQNSIKFYAVKR